MKIQTFNIIYAVGKIEPSAKSSRLGCRTLTQITVPKMRLSEFKETNQVAVLIWPSVSPDLNLKENIWQEFKIHKRCSKNFQDFKYVVLR